MRKPPSIVILSLIFLVSPPLILFVNAALNMVPLFGYGSILYRLRFQDYFILILYFVAAISIFLVRKWGWWTLVSAAALMILHNFISLLLNPFASVVIVLLMNLVLFSTALLFFRKHLIAPYFNPRLRWWEQDQRFEIDIYLKFPDLDRNVIISDISSGGCYIFVDFLIDKGAELPVVIVCGSFHLSLSARIMRISRESGLYYGYGLMFLKTDPVQRAGLESLLDILKTYSPEGKNKSTETDKRTSRRYHVPNELTIECLGDTWPVQLTDISMSGCALNTGAEISIGLNCRIFIPDGKDNHSLEGTVVWKKNAGENYHFGLKFLNCSGDARRSLRKLIREARSLGAKERKADMEDYYRMCDESARQTPYRIISWIKSLPARR